MFRIISALLMLLIIPFIFGIIIGVLQWFGVNV